MQQKSVRFHLRQFCRTTTVKGVSRAARADRRWLKVVWILAVVLCIASSALHSFSLIDAYFDFPKSISIGEGSTAGTENSDLFPAVTTCNIKQLSKRRTRDDMITYAEYINMVKEDLFCINCTGTQRLKPYRESLLSLKGYYQYIGPEGAEIVGHNFDDFVVTCDVLLRKSASLSLVPCNDYANISLQRYPDYFNCYTLTPRQHGEDVIVGFSLVLYVDSAHNENVWESTRHSSDPKSLSKGAIITFNERSAFPFVTKTGLTLAPGQFTTIKLEIKERYRLPPPHESCVNRADVGYQGNDGTPILYDGYSCWTACAEKQVVQHCGCKDVGFPGVLYWKHLSYPYCGDTHAPIDVLTARLNCSEVVRAKYSDLCYYNCHLPCDEVDYLPMPSHLAWPSFRQVHTFYEEYIAGKPAQQLFGTISNLTDGECTTLHNCSKRKDVYKLIKRNFLGVKVFVPNFRFSKVVTDKHITLSSLISQLGGALNLWSGISIVVIIELGELLINIFINIKDRLFAGAPKDSTWPLHCRGWIWKPSVIWIKPCTPVSLNLV